MTFTKSVYFGVTDARCDVTVSGAEFCANADGRVVSLENVVIFFFASFLSVAFASMTATSFRISQYI